MLEKLPDSHALSCPAKVNSTFIDPFWDMSNLVHRQGFDSENSDLPKIFASVFGEYELSLNSLFMSNLFPAPPAESIRAYTSYPDFPVISEAA